MTIVIPTRKKGIRDKLLEIDWLFVALVCAVATVGVAALYSVADGSWTPWAGKHAARFSIAVLMLAAIAVIGLRFWMVIAYPVYFAVLGLLALVPFVGAKNMGAQRWLEYGGLQLQPSELMKIALVLALARYFHGLRIDQVRNPLRLIPALLMIAAPVALVFQQPDLGTAILIAATGAVMIFASGVSWWLVLLGAGGLVGAGIGAYRLGILKEYQINRILTFLDPSRDPLGQGYHLLQSKIALGSAGIEGKGFLQGTQSHLKFLPEMHTDFVFTIFGEEFGLIGALVLLALYLSIFWLGLRVAMRAKSHFGRLVTVGVCATFIMYVLINTGMVMGLAPVVGVPLPLVSYGGTVMMTIMAGFGLVMSTHVHRDQDTLRSGELL
ncbi:MAG: rod shape-determining protein RodA [Pseudomonadota bacterium]